MSERAAVKRPGGRVLMVQRRLTHYRVPFFERLSAALGSRGMDLTLGIGQPNDDERMREDAGALDGALPLVCRQWAGGRAAWLSLGALCEDADLVVLPQENRLLSNVPLLIRRHPFRVALWGHGQDMQAGPGPLAALARHWKANLTRRADWWFAYTATSANVLCGLRCPPQRISTVDNAVDTVDLSEAVTRLRQSGASELRLALGLAEGPVGLFLGSLVSSRRLDLLLAAATRLRATCPSFQLLIAGDGPLAGWLRDQVCDAEWVRVVGAVHGERKHQCLAVAELMLMPASLGVGLLEALACGVPLVTSDAPGHGPEFAYLRPGHNALVVAPRADTLAQAAQALMQQADGLSRLREAGRQTARRYSLDAMVQRFADGLQAWREAPRREGTR